MLCVVMLNDFCWDGSEEFQSTIIGKIREAFSISQEEITTFKYWGLNVKQTNDCISIDQNLYTDELSEAEINSERKLEKHAQLNKEEARQLRGLAGKLNCVSSQTRPDKACSACEEVLLLKCNHCWVNQGKEKHSKTEIRMIVIKNSRCRRYWSEYHCSFANLKDHFSQSGYIIFLYKNIKSFSPVAWKSRKIKRVVKSSLAAEILTFE